jgi:Family of unknown function (DUF6498)
MNNILQSPLFQHPKAWWMPFIPLLITLHGILFLNWNLQPIALFFWWEVIVMFGVAFFRMVCAMDNKPFSHTILPKIGMLVFGSVMGIAFIMLTVTFTFKVFSNGFNTAGMDSLSSKVDILIAGQVVGLIIHFFANGRYKTANPMGELMSVFIHLLILVALIMALTMHLIPKFPQLNQAVWVTVSIVVLKFMVDMLFSKIREPFKQFFEKNEIEWR